LSHQPVADRYQNQGENDAGNDPDQPLLAFHPSSSDHGYALTRSCAASATILAASGGDRVDGLLSGFKERAEIFKFGDETVVGGDHAVGAITPALEVHPVTSRTLPFGGSSASRVSMRTLSGRDPSVTIR
jgi:hypothetical protein